MLDSLRHFLLIAEHGTFTAAARHAHLSQPALSASIQRLEEAMGARLLHRTSTGATPTASGAALLPWAQATLTAVAQGRRAVRQVEGLDAGEVRLGGGATACTYLLPPLLAAFRDAHPAVRFVLRELDTAGVREAIRAGRLDLGIVTGEGDEPWRTDELIVVGPPGGAERRWVTFPPSSPVRELLDRHAPDADVVMELNNLVAIKAQVRAGMGIALLSRAAVERDIADGLLVELDFEPIRRQLSLVHLGVDRLPPATRALREALVAHRSIRATNPT